MSAPSPEPTAHPGGGPRQTVPELSEQPWVTGVPPGAAEVLRRIFTFPRLVWEHRDLVTTSVRRDLEARFKGTLLGWLWPLIHPLFLFTVYYFLFSKLLGMKLPAEAVAGREAALGVAMFVGVLVWSSFADTLIRSSGVIVENGNLIKKLAFPSEILPLNIALVNAVTQMFGVAVLVVVCFTPLWRVPEPLGLLWIPVLLALQSLFAYGLGLLLSTLHVFLRDTAQIAALLIQVWMFLTPIFWLAEMPGIREHVTPYLGAIEANPMYHLVYAWRWVLMSHEPALLFGSGPAAHVGVFSVWALAAFALGYTVFILGQRRFADEV